MSTLIDFNFDDSPAREYFISIEVKGVKIQYLYPDLMLIFELNMTSKNLFPNIKLSNTSDNWQTYLLSCVQKYLNASTLTPSYGNASPSTSPYDPIINNLVQRSLDLTNSSIKDIENFHKLSMQAENIIGGLLEEYISDNIRQYNWIWCKGETVKSVDFYNIESKCLLQIKNKFNTENSCSSSVRNNTPILKWFRIGKKTLKKEVIADFKWDKLNQIVSKGILDVIPNLSEKGFQNFIFKVVERNPNLLYKL